MGPLASCGPQSGVSAALSSREAWAGMQLQLYYEWLGQARHQMWVGPATFSSTT